VVTQKAKVLIVGRSPDCDLVLTDRSVSGRHARLAWSGDRIIVEDLGSANGTWVGDKRIERAVVRPGEEVRFGDEHLSWSEPRLKEFLRGGARGDTVMGTAIPGRRFICGACGTRGLLPPSFAEGEVRCGQCGATLVVGKARARWVVPIAAGAVVLALGIGIVAWVMDGSDDNPLQRAAERLGLPDDPLGSARAASPQEASIRSHVARRVVAAANASDPTTRNTAVQIAASDQGPFHMEQVARIWTYVRERWRYVNDPRGGEYFATASETINNAYAGDCDDFAILLSAMISSIGGETRVVMMDGPRGGHAYTEACIQEDAQSVARRLSKHYRRTWDRYVTRERGEVHFRTSPQCQVWLNLDWNAGVPGGEYTPEDWAVAIYSDGRTETLAPSRAGAVARSNGPSTSALPPRD
jgi:hypothetical protein